jgi:hypothetical protein
MLFNSCLLSLLKLTTNFEKSLCLIWSGEKCNARIYPITFSLVTTCFYAWILLVFNSNTMFSVLIRLGPTMSVSATHDHAKDLLKQIKTLSGSFFQEVGYIQLWRNKLWRKLKPFNWTNEITPPLWWF